MVLQFFANISRIENDQQLKLDDVAVFEHVNISSGLDHRLGSHNFILFKRTKTDKYKIMWNIYAFDLSISNYSVFS